MDRCISRFVVLVSLFDALDHAVRSQRLVGLPVDILDAAPEPTVSFSPDTQWMLLMDRDAMPGIDDVSRRMLRLAGLRIDPDANGQFQTSFYKALSIRARDSKGVTRLPLPDEAKLSRSSWSGSPLRVQWSLSARRRWWWW